MNITNVEDLKKAYDARKNLKNYIYQNLSNLTDRELKDLESIIDLLQSAIRDKLKEDKKFLEILKEHDKVETE